jgi:signal transduction histidine kinase/CheY-like chemotaxis protein
MASGLLETTPHTGEPTDRTLDFMAGGGRMGALMRARDWSSSPLGPVETWPQSLRTTISTCLECAFPIVVWWGPRLVMLYNDEYRMILGSEKHPLALGAAGRSVFPELWDLIGPMLDQVLREGRATRSRDLMLVMNRYGYDEETYFSFSYSPIRDESGGIGGVFTPVVETTERVIGERRLRTLRDLAARPRPAGLAEAAAAAAEVLAENPYDLPFALIYHVDHPAAQATLIGAAGIPAGAAVAPSVRALSSDADAAFDRVAQGGCHGLVEALDGGLDAAPHGAWPEPPKSAIILPITPPGWERPIAVLVAAVSPRRALDAEYRAFFDLVADQLSKTMAEVVAYQEERRRAEALAEIDRAKTQFFANVSHEFRTPLTLMLGPLEALAESGDLTDPQREQVGLAHRNSLRLLKLVNALLDFSRIEAGRARAAFEPVDMAALTADLAANFRSATDRAGLVLRVEATPLPEPVYLDRALWETIVLNLIFNAFKFTFEGEISVSVRASPDGSMALLTVRDTGVGIPTGELSHLFTRFHRVEGARGRSIEGSGIGLALVRELARLHGGEVSVVSAPGEGAAFTVSIPFGKDHLDPGQIAPQASTRLAPDVRGFVEEALRWLPNADAQAPGAEGSTPPPCAFAGGGAARRVLVADDNADMRDYVRRLLEGEGYRVSVASDGLEALAAAVSDPPDLVLSDVMMPGLDGFGLIQGLRARPATRTAPVILLSARAGEEARIEGLKAGAEDYLVKPFSARELVARVEAAIKLTETRQDAAKALRDENMRMRRLFEQAPGFVCILAGPGHVIEFANAAAQTIFGKRDLVGKSVLAAVPEVERQGFIALLDAVYATGQRFVGQEVPLRLDQPDGGEGDALYLDFIYEPIIDAAGQVTGIFVEGHDVTERRHYEQHLHLLIEELNHRVKNTLAIVQSVSRQTFRTPGDPEERRQAFDGRLSALAAAHGLLTRANWEAADLKAIALTVLGAQSDGAERYRIEGPRVKLEPKTAVTLAMAFHELCTNATKYGALSVENGAIELTWRVEPGPAPRLRLSWRENGGPRVSAPSRRGFGARMIERALASELNGQVRLDFLPTGLECHIDAPLPVTAGAMFKPGDRP